MMKSLLLLVLAFVCFAIAADTAIGIAYITGTTNDPNIRGTVTFTLLENNLVEVSVNVTGITESPSSTRGIHVHTYGDLRPTTLPTAAVGASVGPHWNPLGVAHGCPDVNGDSRENGDMGNWDISEGSIVQTKTLDLLTLQGDVSMIGRAVVIHATTDNCVNMTSAAGRQAWGVIGIANVAGNKAYQSLATVSTATCYLQPTSSAYTIGGLITFAVTANGVVVKASVTGLTGVHGFHIHAFGDLLNANQIGGHYDPLNTNVHALPGFLPAQSHHIGDLGNICYNSTTDGVVTHYYSTTFATDSPVATAGIVGANGIIGRAMAVHAGADNSSTTLYGARIGFCVIGVSAADNLASAVFPEVPDNLCGYVAPSATTTTTTGSAATTGSAGTTTSAASVVVASLFVVVASFLALF